MTALNSRRSAATQTTPEYVTSESGESDWGQPPASLYVFTQVGNRLLGEPIAGVYVTASSSEPIPADPSFITELACWDEASDEALSSFEASLD